jgi:hypothetical protein
VLFLKYQKKRLVYKFQIIKKYSISRIIFYQNLGLVLEKSNDTSSYETSSSFDKLHSWQLDQPNVNFTNDPLTSTLNDWMKVSEIVSIELI